MNKYYIKGIILVLASFLGVVGIMLGISRSVTGNSVVFILLFCGLIILVKKALEVEDKSVRVGSFIFATVFSAIEVIGSSLEASDGLLLIYATPKDVLLSITMFIGLLIVIYYCSILMYNFLLYRNTICKKKESFLFSSSKKSFFTIMLIIFLAWLPYFIIYYPGTCSPDSFDQIKQSMGINEVTNHHPVFHTFLIYLCLQISFLFKGSVSSGVAIYSLFQMIAMSFIFTYALWFMIKKTIHKCLCMGVLIYFAFSPINAVFSITMWKDILFGGMMLLFTIFIIDMYTQTEAFFMNKKKIALFFLIIIGIILLRNNGFYVILLSFPFFIFSYRNSKLEDKSFWNHRSKLVVGIIIVITFFFIYTGPLFSALSIKHSSVTVALSIPSQQIARKVKYRGDRLTEAEQGTIKNLFLKDDIGDSYNPRLANPVWTQLDEEYIRTNTKDFLKLWWNLFLKYPKVYIESYLANSFGYWYPETVYETAYTTVNYNEFGVSQNNFPQVRAFINRLNIMNPRNIPVISMIYSIGFWFMMFLYIFILVCIKRQKRFLLTFVPLIFLLLTTTASPVYAEYRYVFSMFTCFPILLSFSLTLEDKRKSIEIVEDNTNSE